MKRAWEWFLFVAAVLIYVWLGLATLGYSQSCWGASSGAVVTVQGDTATYPTHNPGCDGWYTAPLYGQGWWIRYDRGALAEAWLDGKSYVYQQGKWVLSSKSVGGSPELLPEPRENFGVDPAKRQETPPGKYHNGRQVSNVEANDMLAAADLPDESGKVGYLVFVGSSAKAKDIQAALDRQPGLKAKVFFQAYEPTDWAAERYALRSTPKFKDMALILSQLDGKVDHVQYDFKADDLKVVEQNWKPEEAPDIREKGWVQKASDWADENPMPCCAAAAVVFLFAVRRKKQQAG